MSRFAHVASERGDRGKEAEGVVGKLLARLNGKYSDFAYERVADARAAGGRLKASLCDYLAWWRLYAGDPDERQISYQIEVKQTKHDYRLSKDKLEQLPRLRKIRLAGGMGIVIVYHSEAKLWRCLPLEFFDGDIPASWDLRGVPSHTTLEDAIYHSGIPFPPVK